MSKCRVSLGVDVGGTFTKAVAAKNSDRGIPIAVHSVPTTYEQPDGVARGATDALLGVLEKIDRESCILEQVTLSTTQAVNALLEGDTAKVGILAIALPKQAKRVRRHTKLKLKDVAPGHKFSVVHEVVECEPKNAAERIHVALTKLTEAGAEAIAVSQAFAADNPTLEKLALEIAAERGLPICAGHEISGLYGLELRTQTAALNASILPVMQKMGKRVKETLKAAGIDAPLLIMRGDGGCAPIEDLKLHPIRTLFSGPAASVAGARHATQLKNALVIEHGGTSTNIAAVVDGEPARDYVQVSEFATCVRALDVHVVGVAGGSLIRQVGRKQYRLGPRSAHHAGLKYSCFSEPLEDARPVKVAPLESDPETYLVVEGNDGRRVAVTPTCCANALDQLPEDDPANGSQEAAQIAVAAVAQMLGRDWRSVAEEILAGAAQAILELARPVIEAHPSSCQNVVGAGGAACVLGPAVAKQLGANYSRLPQAEVISSVGAACAKLRSEVERTVPDDRPECWRTMEEMVKSAAKSEVLRYGATEGSIDIKLEHDREHGRVRACATGRFHELDRESLLEDANTGNDLQGSSSCSKLVEA